MDPATVLAVVNGSLGVATTCITVIQGLNDLASKYRQAELLVQTMVDECKTIQLAWDQIETWARRHETTTLSVDDQILERLGSSLATGTMVLSALEEDLRHLGQSSATTGLRRRSKVVWNQNVFRDHKDV